MTATDETKLREMLDERGIPWRETISGHTGWETEHGDDAVTMRADAGLVMLHAWVTPEQAIAATLGPGTCENEAPEPYYFVCSKCGIGLNFNVRFCPFCGAKVVNE